MGIKFSIYAKVKDNYCVCYFGRANEYITQLRLVRPRIQQKFPGINIYIGCKDEVSHLVEGEDKILFLSSLKVNKFNFAHIKEIKSSTEGHPIQEFFEESDIDYQVINDKSEILTHLCVIAPFASYPANPLTSEQIEQLVNYAKSKGFQAKVNVDHKNAGWVLGAENEAIFEAASQGSKTTLVPTGLGTNLYEKMFPNGEVLHL